LSRTVSGSEFHSVGPEYEKLEICIAKSQSKLQEHSEMVLIRRHVNRSLQSQSTNVSILSMGGR